MFQKVRTSSVKLQNEYIDEGNIFNWTSRRKWPKRAQKLLRFGVFFTFQDNVINFCPTDVLIIYVLSSTVLLDKKE